MGDKPGEQGKPANGTTTPETLEDALKALAERDATIETLTKERDDWKGHARTWETRAGESQAKVKEYEDAANQDKSETEKLADRLAALEKENSTYKARDERAGWIKEISEANGFEDRGISPDLLRGSTRDDLEDHAKALLQAFPEKPNGAPADGSAGGVGGSIGEGERSADDVVDAALGVKK